MLGSQHGMHTRRRLRLGSSIMLSAEMRQLPQRPPPMLELRRAGVPRSAALAAGRAASLRGAPLPRGSEGRGLVPREAWALAGVGAGAGCARGRGRRRTAACCSRADGAERVRSGGLWAVFGMACAVAVATFGAGPASAWDAVAQGAAADVNAVSAAGGLALLGLGVAAATRERRGDGLQPAGRRKRYASDVQELFAVSRGRRNEVLAPDERSEETFEYQTLAQGTTKAALALPDWTPAEELSGSYNGLPSISNQEFRDLVHELLTRDGFVVLRPETLAEFAKDDSEGMQRFLSSIFEPAQGLVEPLKEGNHIKRNGKRISCFHLDETPTVLQDARPRLLVNIWWPSLEGEGESKRLAIGRGSAYAGQMAEVERIKAYGPGPRVPRPQPTINFGLSREGAVELAQAGDLALTPARRYVVFISGTTSNGRVPFCPHAGALVGPGRSSQEFRYHVHPKEDA